MSLQKWKLLKSEKKAPSPWFPYEVRTYELPDGTIVDDFYVSTLSDSVHIIAQTTENKIVLIRMFKQGVNELMVQWPAGRYEEQKHKSLEEAAVKELQEETGISVSESDLTYVGTIALGSTKQSEKIHYYYVNNTIVNLENQNLDDTEEIEVLQKTSQEVEEMIQSGEIADAPCIAGWHLVSKYIDIE